MFEKTPSLIFSRFPRQPLSIIEGMRQALLPLLLLGACASLAGTTIYAGPVTPIAGVCDPPAQGLLTQRAQAIVFSANSGSLVLQGRRTGDVLAASLTLVGADKKPYDLTFAGSIAGKAITGIYKTPRCRYRVALRRTDD
jgi:hypothetical protein